jgi:hypothetical protein
MVMAGDTIYKERFGAHATWCYGATNVLEDGMWAEEEASDRAACDDASRPTCERKVVSPAAPAG